MDLKKKLVNAKEKALDEVKDQEFSDKFELTNKAKEKIDEAPDIEDFLKQEQKEEQQDEEEENDPDDFNEQKPMQSLEESVGESNMLNSLTLYVDQHNIKKSKEAIKGAVENKFAVGLKAIIEIKKENVEKVNSMLDVFTQNGYVVVVSAEKVDLVFK